MLERIDMTKPNFITLNQRGSHTSSVNLYPDDFEKFNGYYDNSVLYTDFVLAGIYDYLKNNSPNETYLIFTSDHGELLGEVKGKKGHGWFEKEIYNVPYLYFALNVPDSADNAQDMVRCHFDVSTLVQKLLGYDSEVETDDLRTIYVNGSEMNALGGYMVVKTENGNVISKEIVR